MNGSIQVLKDCQDHVRMDFFQEMAADYNRVEFEQYKFSKHLDVGAGVRKTAAEIYHLVSHERELFHVRRSAEKLHQSLSDRGLRSSYPSPKSEDSSTAQTMAAVDGSSFRGESRPPKYSDPRPPKYTDSLPTGSAWDDIGAKIVTHSGTVLDDLHFPEASVKNEHDNRGSSTFATADLLGLDEISFTTSPPPPRSQHQSLDEISLTTTPQIQSPASHGATARTNSRQKNLVATI